MAMWSCLLAVVVATIAQASEGKVASVIQSARGTGDRLSDKGSAEFVPDFPFEGPVVSLSRTFDQGIVGFGGAFTEAAALVFQRLPAAQQQRVLAMYFGPSGIGYTLGRIPINSCDFSPHNYAFDDVAGDFELEFFDSKVTHDTEAMIPLVHAAQHVLRSSGRELKMLATPWSPPAWMKTNGKMDGSDLPGLNQTCRGVWAKYFSKWISAYKSYGIPIWAVTPQNEPDMFPSKNPGPWEACAYTPDLEMDFIAQHLGPTLKADHPEIKVLAYDHHKNHVLKWANALFSNPEAEQYAHGVAFHWYSGDQFDEVAKTHARHPQALLLATEATYEKYRWQPGTKMLDGDWNMAMGYAHDILNDLNAGASGWLDWNLLVDEHGGPNHANNDCDAAMVGDGTELYVHPQYYGIGHFSKYILPESKHMKISVVGSQRYTGPNRDYGTCDERDGLEATSFLRPDGLIVVVVLNCAASPIDFKLQDGSLALRATAPAQGLQTYLFTAASGEIFA